MTECATPPARLRAVSAPPRRGVRRLAGGMRRSASRSAAPGPPRRATPPARAQMRPAPRRAACALDVQARRHGSRRPHGCGAAPSGVHRTSARTLAVDVRHRHAASAAGAGDGGAPGAEAYWRRARPARWERAPQTAGRHTPQRPVLTVRAAIEHRPA
eukprot:scaffold6767_cov223-Isochrysis_galbana.AAC.9